MTLADVIYHGLRPVWSVDPTNTAVTEGLAETIANPLKDTFDVIEGDETRGPWETALDPWAAPATWLAWLAQFPGIELPPSADAAEQRERIAAAAGFYRGTRRAIREEVQRTLTGTQFVLVIVRADGERWKQIVVTRTSETPDPDATAAAALAQKPAGVIQEMVTSDSPLIDEGILEIDDVAVAIDDAEIGDVT